MRTFCFDPVKRGFAKKAFLVGDGPIDIRIAKEAGVYAIGISHIVKAEPLIKARENKVVNDFKDLKK